jgi:hypothetical protein
MNADHVLPIVLKKLAEEYPEIYQAIALEVGTVILDGSMSPLQRTPPSYKNLDDEDISQTILD